MLDCFLDGLTPEDECSDVAAVWQSLREVVRYLLEATQGAPLRAESPIQRVEIAQQDATAIGTIGIIMGWWNAFNGPFVARWADSGALNRRVPCFASWGRRAPWLLLGAPLLMAGTVLMWLPPAFDDVTLLVWYTMCYFLVINGGTATLQAYLSGIQELYGTGRLG